jgi:hypothetical protein
VDAIYSPFASGFLEACNPIAASELVGQARQIGEETITRDNLRIIGRMLRESIFEILAVAQKFKARILTFGERLVNLLFDVRIIVFSLHHRMKDQLKKRSRTRAALKIGIWILAAGASIEARNQSRR